MVERVLDNLNLLGYSLLDECSLKEAIAGGSKSVPFTQLIEWVTKELQVLYSLDEYVNAISSPADSSAFLLELSSFLKESGCQYSVLMEGPVNERLHTEENKLLLLNYLLSDLKSARMLHTNKKNDGLQVTLNESSTALDLKNTLRTLEFPRPPADIPPKVLFDKAEAKLKEITSKLPVALYGEALFTRQLSDKQWHTLEKFYKELFLDYEIRREMLLKRLDVTMQSFQWSDRLKSKSQEIYTSFRAIREKLSYEPTVRLSDVLSARKDLAVLEKSSSASVRRLTQSYINTVMIGTVPDRGGRPYEQEPPPPEMPSWQKRNAGPGGSGGRGRGNQGRDGCDQRGNRGAPPTGGRVQAGWSEPLNDFRNSYDKQPYQQRNYDQDKYGGQGGYQNQGNRSGRNQYYQNRNDNSRSYRK